MERLGTWLRTDIRYFLKGGLWLSLPIVANHLLGLIRSVAFARLTGQSTYGQFGFVNSVVGTLSILALPGIEVALTETVARGNLGSLTDAAWARARWGLLSSLAMAGVSGYYTYLGKCELAAALLVAGAFLPFISALRLVQAYYNGRKLFNMVGLISTGTVLTNTVAVLLVLWLGKGVLWLVVAVNGSQLVFYFVFYTLAARHARRGSRDPAMVAYGRSLTFSQAISSVAFYLDGVILGLTASFEDVAIYTVASFLPESLKGFVKTLTPLAMPKIAEQPGKRVYSPQTMTRLLFLLILNLLVVLVAILAIPTILAFFYGELYAASRTYAQLLMLSLVAGWPSSFFDAALQARKRTRDIYCFNLIYGALQVSSLIIFVPLWGILGIVLSRIVTRLGATLYQWYAVTKI